MSRIKLCRIVSYQIVNSQTDFLLSDWTEKMFSIAKWNGENTARGLIGSTTPYSFKTKNLRPARMPLSNGIQFHRSVRKH